MKTFFSLPKNPNDSPYKKHISKELGEEQHNKLIELDTKIDKFDRKKAGFGLIRTVGVILAALCAIALIGRIIGNEDVWGTGLALSIILIVAISLGIALLIVGLILIIKLENSDIRKNAEYEYEQYYRQCCYDLGATEPIKDIDIYMPEVSFDELGNETVGNPLFHTCLNLPTKVYLDASNDMVGIIFLESVITIPKDAFTKMEKLDKRLNINAWNKKTPLNKEPYTDCKITTSSYGYSVKGYYKVFFKLDDEEYYFIVPEYDAKIFADQIGLTIE